MNILYRLFPARMIAAALSMGLAGCGNPEFIFQTLLPSGDSPEPGFGISYRYCQCQGLDPIEDGLYQGSTGKWWQYSCGDFQPGAKHGDWESSWCEKEDMQ